MNFLEQVIAEWFSHKGYFVKTNIKFGKLPSGGFAGEVDVVAFHPQTRELVHIEASTDGGAKRFKKKFDLAKRYYGELFEFSYDYMRCMAIGGFAYTATPRDKKILGEKIEVESVPEFFRKASACLRECPISKQAISETLPLLRAMQFTLHLGQEKAGHATDK